MSYTYTIFDANPNSSSGTAWPSHSDVEIEADSDENAVAEVRDVMEIEAAGLSAANGYVAGDCLHAIVWDEDGVIVGMPTHQVTFGTGTED